MRLVPPWFDQGQGMTKLLDSLDFRRLLLIYDSTDRKDAATFETQGRKKHMTVDGAFEIENDTVTDTDFEMAKDASTSNVMVALQGSALGMQRVIDVADRHGYFDSGRLWLVSEYIQALGVHLPQGILGTRLDEKYSDRKTNLMILHKAVKTAFSKLWKWNSEETKKRGRSLAMSPPNECTSFRDMGSHESSMGSTEFWITFVGKKFYSYLIEYKHSEVQISGDDEFEISLEFNVEGDRKNVDYDIINTQLINETMQYVKVGSYKRNKTSGQEGYSFTIDYEKVTWLGGKSGKKHKPRAFAFKKNIRIVTVEDSPFVYVKPLSDLLVDNCTDFKGVTIVDGEQINGDWLPCHYENLTTDYCCTGLCIDLMTELTMTKVMNDTVPNLKFSIEVVTNYGSNRRGPGQWSGSLGRLLNTKQEYDIDMIVAALTINQEREKVVSFSAPFMYHGISIMEKTKPRLSPMHSFLQPFEPPLWCCIFLSVFIIGVALCIIDKYSPFNLYDSAKNKSVKSPSPRKSCESDSFGIFKPQKNLMHDNGDVNNENDDDQPLNMSGSMWFVWGVLLDSGIGERVPRGLSARVLGVVWCGFCMIMVASYTANLAAFLVLDRPTSALSGINDIRLRNPNGDFKYATVKESNTFMYFARHVEHSTMYRTMEKQNVDTASQAVKKLKKGELNAFIWDSKKLEFEASKDCELSISGEEFGKASYAVGLKKTSIFNDPVTLAVLELVENGRLEDMESHWIENTQMVCPSKESSHPVRLGLVNMKDLFVLIGAGFLFGSLLISIETIYMRRKIRNLYQQKIALYYGRIWRKKCAQQNQIQSYNCSPPIVLGRPNSNNNCVPTVVLQHSNKNKTNAIGRHSNQIDRPSIVSANENLDDGLINPPPIYRSRIRTVVRV